MRRRRRSSRRRRRRRRENWAAWRRDFELGLASGVAGAGSARDAEVLYLPPFCRGWWNGPRQKAPLLSRVVPPPAIKGGPFIAGGGTTRDKRGLGTIRGKRIQRLRPVESNGLEPLDADQPHF